MRFSGGRRFAKGYADLRKESEPKNSNNSQTWNTASACLSSSTVLTIHRKTCSHLRGEGPQYANRFLGDDVMVVWTEMLGRKGQRVSRGCWVGYQDGVCLIHTSYLLWRGQIRFPLLRMVKDGWKREAYNCASESYSSSTNYAVI